MKTIQKIAIAELRYLFYSPIAWMVALIIYLLASNEFFSFLDLNLAKEIYNREINPYYLGLMVDGYTKLLSSKYMNGFTNHLYLILPLLTMSVFNREVNSGSINLLFTSPVSVTSIILGKFVGVTYFNFMLICLYALNLLIFSQVTEQADVVQLLLNVLGIFLIFSLYAAAGIFFSVLTRYQLVSATLAILLFYLLNTLYSYWQEHEILRDITFHLNYRIKAFYFNRGIYSNSLLLYFVLLIFLFLLWAVFVLKAKMESTRGKVTATKFMLSFICVVGIIYVTAKPGSSYYHDLTVAKEYELHSELKNIFQQLDGSPITVTLYNNILAPNSELLLPKKRNAYIWDSWHRYINFYNNIEFKYCYYYALAPTDSLLRKRYPGKNMEELVGILSALNGMDSAEIKHYSSIASKATIEKEEFTSFMELDYKGKKEVLRFDKNGRAFPGGSVIAAALKRLTRDEDVKISFLTGHYERDPFSLIPRHYGKQTSNTRESTALVNLGVDIDTISVENAPVQEDVQLLVIADPRTNFSEKEQLHITEYLEKGGNAIILGEPGRKDVLNSILQKIGVRIDDGTIVEVNGQEMPHIFRSPFTHTGHHLSLEFVAYQWYGRTFTYSAGSEGAANLTYNSVNDFSVVPIISKKGGEYSWIENGVLVVDSAAPVFTAKEGDIKLADYTIAVALTRNINGKEQRIIVSGDADIISNNYTDPMKFCHALYNWGLYNSYPIYLTSRFPSDGFLTITEEGHSNLTTVFLYIVPLVFFIVATIFLIRRNRK